MPKNFIGPIIEDPVLRLRLMLLLENLTLENTGWWRFFRRWQISDEPLRNDAKNILEQLKELQLQQEDDGKI